MNEEPVETTVAPFEARTQRSSSRFEVLFWALILLGSVLFVFSGLTGGGSFRSVLSTVLGSLGTLGSLAGGRNALGLLRGKAPALRITDEGIHNRTYWHSASPVPWEDVLEIRRTRIPGIWEIVLRDPEEYLSRQTRTVRIWSRVTSFLGIGRFPLYLRQLPTELRREVPRRLTAVLEAKELAAIREERLLEGSTEEPGDAQAHHTAMVAPGGTGALQPAGHDLMDRLDDIDEEMVPLRRQLRGISLFILFIIAAVVVPEASGDPGYMLSVMLGFLGGGAIIAYPSFRRLRELKRRREGLLLEGEAATAEEMEDRS